VSFSAEEHQLYEKMKKGVIEIIDAAVMQFEIDGERSYFNALQRINDLRYICNHGVTPLRKRTKCGKSIAVRGKQSISSQSDVLLGANNIETCDLCGNELLDEQELEEDLLQADDTPSSAAEARLCRSCAPSAYDSRPLSPFSTTSSTPGSYANNLCSTKPISSKAHSLVRAVQEVPVQDKCVVFSYWTSSLDLVGRALSNVGITSTRYIGSMPRQKRDSVLSEFATNLHIKVILVSISCGGTGLDLTAANHAFLLEPQWNPMLEEQAMARVHRIGQKKPVRLVRLIVKDTWEEKIVTLQNRKRLLAKLIVDGEHVGNGDDGKRRLLWLKDLVA